MRTLVLAALGLALAGLFVDNVLSLGEETEPLVWAAAGAAALGGAGLFVVLLGHPPAFVERLTGPRRGLLPIAAAGIAVVVVTYAPPAGQLVALAFCAGLLGAALASGWRRRSSDRSSSRAR